ncbi:glycosyl hydrolase family 28-related protein [Jannaschia aquimarina]|uniref:Pectate lyase superfamily protein n=1 Tax=Jannaschia aquimarina TaxID=935700 RepID=A0A0D1EL11_9RHOB|nr:glycosyl hydrolase family 28-related protein [Jannaschia aquimarina]KIT17671.1 Pectate lyase superfamily protein [Jannaschia aquimarina]SNS79432.1 Pectate lyase superfamily protein [Jannaschia aquimarina]
MNKAITEGLQLTPDPFIDGLQNWSSQNGRHGDDSYINRSDAVVVPADQDFGGCVEISKTMSVQPLRWFTRIPVTPGCYLRVRARVKMVSGNLPDVTVSCVPINSGGGVVSGLPQDAPAISLRSYGDVVVVEGILGTGARGGVDLAWDDRVRHVHVGLSLTGPTGGIIRIDDLEVEDITGAFLRDLIDVVDVRDYGAVGDGSTDDTAAFLAADNAADGRTVLVSAGTYRLTDHVTIDSAVRFEGTVTMPRSKRLQLVRSYDLPTYIDAFGDEQEGFQKAIQALFDFTDHDTLDMMGRRVELTQPTDVQAAVGDKRSYANQRKIRNGQIHIQDGPAFNTETHSEACTYDPDRPKELSDVANVSAIPVGSLVVAGQGVGREVYVSGKDVARNRLYLSQPLWGAPSSQTYTFHRFKYALDFSGFDNLQRFVLQDIEFLLADKASGILLPKVGLIFHVKDCFFTGPKDRGLTSHAEGCQGLLIDRCQFLSSESGQDVADRHTIGFNTNKNDTKIRNNRAVRFRTWAVMGGTGHIVTGNHFFQGDTVSLGPRTAGIVFAEPQAKTVFSANYVDNCYIEWTNEYDPAPDFSGELSFGGLHITGNIIFSSNVSRNYAPIHVKPFGSGHYLNGMSITANTFKTIKGQALDRVDLVDTTHADLDYGRFVDVAVHSNTFHGIGKQIQNPVTVPIVSSTGDTTWDIDLSDFLPFGGEARVVTAIVPEGRIKDNANATIWDMPYCAGGIGANRRSVRVNWRVPARGKVFVTARCDAPT